jgi:16S rRNA processing protein RimM
VPAPPGRTSACCSRLSSNEDYIPVGRVGKPHGLEGAFAVEQASETPERFAPGALVYVDGRPARIVESKRARGRPVIRLERPVERGSELAVRRSELPPPAADSYYVVDLVGLAVEEEDGRPLGRVVAVTPAPANDVLELDTGLSLPLVDACVRQVDVESGRIVVAPGFNGAG